MKWGCNTPGYNFIQEVTLAIQKRKYHLNESRKCRRGNKIILNDSFTLTS